MLLLRSEREGTSWIEISEGDQSWRQNQIRAQLGSAERVIVLYCLALRNCPLREPAMLAIEMLFKGHDGLH